MLVLVLEAYYCKGVRQELINQHQERIRLSGYKPDALKALGVAYHFINLPI
jgi:hypothetical protein